MSYLKKYKIEKYKNIIENHIDEFSIFYISPKKFYTIEVYNIIPNVWYTYTIPYKEYILFFNNDDQNSLYYYIEYKKEKGEPINVKIDYRLY